MFLALLMLPWEAAAASKNFKIIDPTVYRRVREQAAVSEADVKLYRDIFAALKANDIKTAEELQKQLKGHALLGHVLAEKYQIGRAHV